MDLDEWNYLDDSSDDGWSEDNDDFSPVTKRKNKSGFGKQLRSEIDFEALFVAFSSNNYQHIQLCLHFTTFFPIKCVHSR